MYSVVLTEKINALERVRAWANDCGQFCVRDHLASAITVLSGVRNEVIRSEEAAASSCEQTYLRSRYGLGRC